MIKHLDERNLREENSDNDSQFKVEYIMVRKSRYQGMKAAASTNKDQEKDVHLCSACFLFVCFCGFFSVFVFVSFYTVQDPTTGNNLTHN